MHKHSDNRRSVQNRKKVPQDGCRAKIGVMVPVQPDAISIIKTVVSAELLPDISSECKNYPAEPASVEEVTRAEQEWWFSPLKKKKGKKDCL